MVTIGSNILSIRAQRAIGSTTDTLTQSAEKLSSGLRINHSSDDAAGLAVASKLAADSRIFAVGVRNLNDGISLTNVVEGALKELSTITTRQLELAEQAANGILSTAQRASLNNEAQALAAEYTRIARTTSFNGIKLLDGSSSSIQVQAGYGSEGIINVGLTAESGAYAGDGSFSAAYSVSGPVNQTVQMIDFNKDGLLDLAGVGSTGWFVVRTNNGNGTFRTYQQNTSDTSGVFVAADFNGDGNLDAATIRYTPGKISVMPKKFPKKFPKNSLSDLENHSVSS
jgi:flagellin-like hook-associated protein FlgL